MQVSKYEGIAQSFLNDHPLGTIVTASKIQDWVAKHPDGMAIKPDLAIPEDDKRISTLRRHLNHGGRSEAMAEARRFQIQVEDAKRGVYVVRSHAAITQDQVTSAVGKSINGALSPLKSAQRAVADIKLDELPEIERQTLEMARANVTAMEAAVKPTLAMEVDRIWVAELTKRGIPADQAMKIREALPQVTRLQKLLRATS